MKTNKNGEINRTRTIPLNSEEVLQNGGQTCAVLLKPRYGRPHAARACKVDP